MLSHLIVRVFAFTWFASSLVAATYNVRDFGVVGDGVAKDTAAFQLALDTCAVNGGGEVLVPAGKYRIGSIQIGTRTLLRLEKESVVIGSDDPNDYPMVDVRWEGRWQPGRRALIYADNVDHTGIIGPGRIEGNTTVAAPQNPRGVVVLEAINCTNLRWEDFTVTQGGNWATHPTYCSDVVIKNLTITGARDGIDVDSCKNVRIEGCHIDCGDDSISLKSGRGRDGARIGRPTENVVISNCTLICRRFAAIGIGSETSAGVRDVRIENCKLEGKTAAIYIKTRIGRAGVTENIVGENLGITGGGFLRIRLLSAGNANTADDPVPGLIGHPSARQLAFNRVRLHDVAYVADAVEVSAEKPIEGLALVDISGTAKKGISLAHVNRAEIRKVSVKGIEGPLLSTEAVNGVGLEGAVALKPPPNKEPAPSAR